MPKSKVYSEEEKLKVLDGLKPIFEATGKGIDFVCGQAGVPSSTVKGWLQKDRALRLKVIQWQNYNKRLALETIHKNLKKKNDVRLAQWFVEKTDSDFNPKQLIEQETSYSSKTVDSLKEIAQELKNGKSKGKRKTKRSKKNS